MIKVKLYGKTQRLKETENTIVTEKMDGSNLVLFKKDGVLHIGERNTIYTLDEVDEINYKGLKGWIAENGLELQEALLDNSAIVGEWIGMGRLKYPENQDRFQMFAKANVYNDYELVNIRYEPNLFQYPFKDQSIPDFIGIVPIIAMVEGTVTIEKLDELYDGYVEEVGRAVEGFIINSFGNIRKYVRNKNGYIEAHKESYAKENAE